MGNYIFFQMHIMWYESKMINETLDSLQNALQYSQLPVNLKFCLNSQTYLEEPIEGNPEDMFKNFINHSVLKDAEIIYKTNDDSFYNIGDWRREEYDNNAKYTIWGESDCLIPYEYFYILSNLSINKPHILSLSSRKMWDNSWTIVEHDYLKTLPRDHKNLGKLSCGSIMNYEDLKIFNEKHINENINIVKLLDHKIDGALLSLSSGLPTPFIGPKQHFVREDTCASLFFKGYKIPQYHISNVLKGHNYNHNLKRTNTLNTRDDNIFKKYEQESLKSMEEFLKIIYG